MVVPVIIAGGTGARLWPLSRPALPKPFMAITDRKETLLRATLRRVAKMPGLETPMVVCDARHEALVREQAGSLFSGQLRLLLEPEGRGTAPALCAAALVAERLAGPRAVLLALPSDHAVADDDAFAAAIASGAELASAGYLVTFAVKPREPATAYGYLRIGDPIDMARRQFRVEAFMEKPERNRAEEFLSSGQYAWNSGIFMFEAATVIGTFQQLQPEILAVCRKALPGDMSDSIMLDPAAFAAAQSISIDYAIMERAGNTAAVVADFGWSDVGDWNAVWEASKDEKGVAARGDVVAIDCEGSLIRSEGPVIFGLGLEDMIVVATKDAVLVASRSRAQDVKRAVEELAAWRRANGEGDS